MFERVMKYVAAGSVLPPAPCCVCNKPTSGRVTNQETGGDEMMCYDCRIETRNMLGNVPFPWRMETRQNLKNHFGCGGFYERTPTKNFFVGLSGRPDRYEPISFKAHECFVSQERYEKETGTEG